MIKKITNWLCKIEKHNNEITDTRYGFGMLTIKTKCKRCGKEGIYKKMM
ncbi:hypothetical protein KNV66_gp30 [Bacillus phage DLc1]|uniref:Uncharacterized protein n=1 Tax=Bacillus phage DLc1 TaxID=2777318 RepID=A0A7M1RPD8_9CAUD|nr:hypothetical protein KNV66_gp30 [Bacillus phage DLc1]QOR56273.1 hypothetical protein [Bacillus phage DLc1]